MFCRYWTSQKSTKCDTNTIHFFNKIHYLPLVSGWKMFYIVAQPRKTSRKRTLIFNTGFYFALRISLQINLSTHFFIHVSKISYLGITYVYARFELYFIIKSSQWGNQRTRIYRSYPQITKKASETVWT